MKNVDINWPVQKLRFDEAMTGARVDPAAGKLLDAARLIRPTDLVDAYYAGVPDPSQASQRVHFGTSGHRGSALRASFNEPHIIAIAQSICLYRKRQGIGGPLFLGIDTHALSRPAFETALEVFVANDVVTMIDGDDGYGTGEFVADPLHYLALIETKPGALDQAAALQDWDLPEVFQHLRHLLEARMGNRGKREFIQVLRLLEAMPMEAVSFAVSQAIQIGAIGFDAVKQIALARIERRPARLDLSAYPHLPKMDVHTTRAADYAALMPDLAA